MTQGTNTTLLHDEFVRRFGREARIFSAPGRINVIGEHTDYNDGFVMPFAIDRRTYVAGSARADRRLVVHSVDLNETAEIDLDEPDNGFGAWSDYVEGIARSLEAGGSHIRGADLLVQTDVPIGAGLSS